MRAEILGVIGLCAFCAFGIAWLGVILSGKISDWWGRSPTAKKVVVVLVVLAAIWATGVILEAI